MPLYPSPRLEDGPKKPEYLKTRTYLYKLTPEFTQHTRRNPGGVIVDINTGRPILQPISSKPDDVTSNERKKHLQALRTSLEILRRRLENIVTTGTLTISERGDLSRVITDIINLPKIAPLSPITNSSFLVILPERLRRKDIVTKGGYTYSQLKPRDAGDITLAFRVDGGLVDTHIKQPLSTHIQPLNQTGAEKSERSLKITILRALEWLQSTDPFGENIIRETDYVRTDLRDYLIHAVRFINNLLQEDGKAAGEVQKKEASARRIRQLYNSQKEVIKFDFDLDLRDFSKFDISPYFVRYNMNQELSSGTINWELTLQDKIVPFNALEKNSNGAEGVRRPVFFPDEKGNYETGTTALSQPNWDPIAERFVSTRDSQDLTEKMAQYETDEDGGGEGIGEEAEVEVGHGHNKASFIDDVIRTEVAMRLRGIANPFKRDFLLQTFKYGVVDPTDGIDSLEEETGKLEADEREILEKVFVEVAGQPSGQATPLQQLNIIKAIQDPKEDGLLVSDLIQKYNIISTLVYAHASPSDTLEEALSRGDPFFFDKESLLLYTPLENVGGLATEFAQLYEIEFTGFILDKSSNETAGQVNTVTVTGVGILGLMASTRRIFNTTIFQQSIFDTAETDSREGTISVFENVFHDLNDPVLIMEFLLDSVYKLDLRDRDRKESIKPSAFKESFFKGNLFRDAQKYASSLLDISEMIRLNRFGETDSKGVILGTENMFSIPMFLYANVMRLRKFNVRTPNISAYPMPASTTPSETFIKENSDDVFLPKEVDGSGGAVLEIDQDLHVVETEAGLNNVKYKPYFLFLSGALGNYTPQLKTPLEIMNDVKGVCYLEFFETPGGRIVLRTPQFNNNVAIPFQATGGVSLNANMITSEEIDPITTEYGQTAQDLITKLQMGYGEDFIPQLAPFLYYHYTNGKLLSQYGLLMRSVQANPNVRSLASSRDLETSENKIKSIFEYCRFFLEYHNMSRRRGAITAKGNPHIKVGQTYFDVGNQKFGYINEVSKTLEVGGSYTMSFQMIAVRDATFAGLGSGAVKHTTVSGDTLSKLSLHYYGNAKDWKRIFDANSNLISDPNVLKIGLSLIIPGTASVTDEGVVFKKVAELEDLVTSFRKGIRVPSAKKSMPAQDKKKDASKTILEHIGGFPPTLWPERAIFGGGGGLLPPQQLPDTL